MSSPAQEVIADQSLEEWTFLGGDGADEEEQTLPHDVAPRTASSPASSTDRSSDIEVIEHDSDEETVQNESAGSISMLLRDDDNEGGMDWSFTDGDGTLDLTPGPKAYLHYPNNSVNFWLNLSLLVAVTSVVGMGLGNYIGSYMNWPRQAVDGQRSAHLKHLQQQLDDCVHEKELLINSTVLNEVRTAIEHDPFHMTTTFPVRPETEIESRQRNLQVHRQSADASPHPTPQSRERHTRHSEVQVLNQQVIIRKSSAIAENAKDNANNGDRQPASEITGKRIVIETSTSISFRAKAKDSSNKRGDYALGSEVKILLLLTDKSTSKPVFLSQEDRPERKKVMEAIFKPFLAEAFRRKEYTVWIESAEEAQDWQDADVLAPDRNAHWAQLRKTTKHFWSNVRKKVFKNWKGGEVSEFKSRLMDVLLSLPESYFQTMFERMESKMRRAAAKTHSRRSKYQPH